MRILIVGENASDYLAKCHEALRTGLRRTFDARPFGPGYSNFDPTLRTYQQIAAHTFPDAPPDLVFTEFELSANPRKLAFPYAGLAELTIPSAILLGDFWNITENCPEAFLDFLSANRVSSVLCYFPQTVRFFAHTPLADRFHLLLPTFDPALFTNWQVPKRYDVGFLAAGTTERHAFYPERYRIHQKLLAQKELAYLWAKHPGWQRRTDDHPLIGAGFSRAINSCRLFITTGGKYRHPNPKYLEILASHAVLLADEPDGAEALGLQDGINYVRISEENVLERIGYLLAQPELALRIAQAGYDLAHRLHCCVARARELSALAQQISGPRVSRGPTHSHSAGRADTPIEATT